VLVSVDWTQAQMINLLWSGFSASGSHDHPHYYKFVISGGQNGIVNGTGAYLKEDIVFHINVTPR
jgi:hypothetical protein